MIRPNTRNRVVTKSKYGPAAGWATQVVVGEAEQELDRERQDDVGDDHADREEERGPAGSTGRTSLALVRGQAGRDERPELVEQDRHREDDPDHDRDLDLDDERVADPEDLERDVAERR